MVMCLPNDSSNITVEVASFEFAVEGFNILLAIGLIIFCLSSSKTRPQKSVPFGAMELTPLYILRDDIACFYPHLENSRWGLFSTFFNFFSTIYYILCFSIQEQMFCAASDSLQCLTQSKKEGG